ncbi:MAG: TlpA family protein disulfide reductase [Mariniblastus sp.]
MNGFAVLQNDLIRRMGDDSQIGTLTNRLGLALFCVCFLFASGCGKKQTQDSNAQTDAAQPKLVSPGVIGQMAAAQPNSGPDAAEILRKLNERFASAKTYRDKAVLYLTYRLQNQNIQEPQPWATTWERSGRLSSQLFNGKIQCDGQLLSGYVYDIDSANLENQHLLIPYENKIPIDELFRDSIAKHFLAGYSELPLDESNLATSPKLIPPPVSLLTNQAPNNWLQNPQQFERLADRKIGDQDCYVIRSLADGMTTDCWIDKQTHLLVQMSLPLKLLAGEVITSPEITEVVLLARFHEAAVDIPIDDKAFAVNPRQDATPVRKFVSLPESFPSELIGETAPDFELRSINGKIRNRLSFDGQITAFLWIAGRPSYSALGKLDKLSELLKNKLPNEKIQLAGVYSDNDLKSLDEFQPLDELAAKIQSVNIPTYYDQGLAASTGMLVKQIPSVIVLDGDSRIQFAKSLSDKNWVNDVAAAIERVSKGEDVALEMQNEYRRYLESYHQQLLTVSAADVAPRTKATSVGNRKMRLNPMQSWANSEFKKAGNICVVENKQPTPNYYIFDGWRTVAEVDYRGKTIARHELKLPDAEAGSLLRAGINVKGETFFTVFGPLGDRVYLFNKSWRPVGTYPPPTADHKGIRDCRLTDIDGDGFSELLVSFDDENGVHLVDPTSLSGKPISNLLTQSVAQFGSDVVVTGAGKIGMLKSGLTNVEETELKFRYLSAAGNQQLCSLGMTSGGKWNAVGFDDELKRVWTLSVGSQFYDCEIEPLAVVAANGEIVWAIADANHMIHLVSGAGKWLGEFQSESPLSGIALSNHNGQTSLVFSNKSGVECWDLNLGANPMRKVSSGNRN